MSRRWRKFWRWLHTQRARRAARVLAKHVARERLAHMLDHLEARHRVAAQLAHLPDDYADRPESLRTAHRPGCPAIHVEGVTGRHLCDCATRAGAMH